MQMIEVTEEHAGVLALLDKLQESGETIIIAQSGKPTAKLVNYGASSDSEVKKRSGIFEGELYIAEDFDVLPEDVQRAFGMID